MNILYISLYFCRISFPILHSAPGLVVERTDVCVLVFPEHGKRKTVAQSFR